jgi:hypothetical protein
VSDFNIEDIVGRIPREHQPAIAAVFELFGQSIAVFRRNGEDFADYLERINKRLKELDGNNIHTYT